jgi:phospholipase/carboxylesterase
MLDFDLHAPAGSSDGARVVVLLHGRGADKDDMFRLGRLLDEDALVVAPRAPFEAAPWGYGPGWAWYRFIAGNRPEPETFSRSLAALGEFLLELPERLPARPGELVLGGFSQGGTMSLGFALREPGGVDRVVNFSGFLADHPEVAATPETVADTAIFWGHGRRDPNIPHALAVEGRALLQGAGARLTAKDYPIGHWIDDQEIRDVREWLRVRQSAGGE